MTNERCLCIDVLRGFFLWNSYIMYSLALALAGVPSSLWRDFIYTQFNHADWIGFHHVDVGNASYMIVLCISMVFSGERRLCRGESRGAIATRQIKRSMVFGIFAFFYAGGFSVPLKEVAFFDTFFQLAMCIFISACFWYCLSPRGLGIALLLVLALQAFWMLGTDVPGYGYGDFSQQGNALLYTRHWVTEHVEAWLGIQDATTGMWVRKCIAYIFSLRIAGTCLIGLLMGHAMIGPMRLMPYGRQVVWWIVVGAVAMGAVKLVDGWIPISKDLWTPTYIVFSAGYTAMMLAGAILLTEVWCNPRLAFFFTVLGKYPLWAWLAFFFLPFEDIAKRFVGENFPIPLGVYHPVVISLVQMLLCWGMFALLQTRYKLSIKINK